MHCTLHTKGPEYSPNDLSTIAYMPVNVRWVHGTVKRLCSSDIGLPETQSSDHRPEVFVFDIKVNFIAVQMMQTQSERGQRCK